MVQVVVLGFVVVIGLFCCGCSFGFVTNKMSASSSLRLADGDEGFFFSDIKKKKKKKNNNRSERNKTNKTNKKKQKQKKRQKKKINMGFI